MQRTTFAKRKLDVVIRREDSEIKWYFYLLKSHAVKLVLMNLLTVLFAIPIVTLPAAITAMNRICVKLIEEGNVLFKEEYFCEFRRSFKKSLFCGLLFLAILFVGYYALSLGLTNGGNLYGMLFSALGLVSFALGIMWGAYSFVLLAYVDLPLKTVLKNAFLLLYAKPSSAFLVLLTIAFSVGFAMLTAPVSFALAAIISLSLTQFTVCFLSSVPIDKYVLTNNKADTANRVS